MTSATRQPERSGARVVLELATEQAVAIREALGAPQAQGAWRRRAGATEKVLNG